MITVCHPWGGFFYPPLTLMIDSYNLYPAKVPDIFIWCATKLVCQVSKGVCTCIFILPGGIIRSHGLFFKRFIERFQQSATATAWVTSLSGTVRLGTGKSMAASYIWASTRENLSSVVYEQHRRRPACASAQSDQRLCYSLCGKYHM